MGRRDHLPEAARRGRGGRPWRRVQRQVYAEETHCWRCGGYVDQTLPAGHRDARSVDHVVPLSRGGDPLDRDGLRLAHHSCNSGAGNRPTTTTMVSRRW